MIKFGLKLGMRGIMGAALMGCSDGTAQDHIEGIMKAETAPATFKTVSFVSDTTCLKKGEENRVSLTFVDGTQLFLPRAWLKSATSENTVSNALASSLSDISQVRFELPWRYGHNGCADTVSVVIHVNDRPLPKDFVDSPNNVSFYSPNFATRDMDTAALERMFSGKYAETSNFDALKVTWPNSSEAAKNYELFSDRIVPNSAEQKNTISDYVYNGFFGKYCMPLDQRSNCGYFEHSSWVEEPREKSKLLFYVPMSSNIEAVFEVQTDPVEFQKGAGYGRHGEPPAASWVHFKNIKPQQSPSEVLAALDRTIFGR